MGASKLTNFKPSLVSRLAVDTLKLLEFNVFVSPKHMPVYGRHVIDDIVRKNSTSNPVKKTVLIIYSFF